MRWSFRRPRAVQRTCLDCGEKWTLEASVSHLKTHRPAGFAEDRPGLGYRGGGQAEEQLEEGLTEIDHQFEMISEANECPKCGSNRYRQRPA
jgi:hypothetical protein